MIVSSPALTLAFVTKVTKRTRSSSAECASVNARTPVAQQNTTTIRCRACWIDVAALAHAAKSSRERRGEQTGECLIEHPRERCEDQRVSRCDDGQRGKRTRHASVAKYAGAEDEHKYQQYSSNETSQQHGRHVGQKPRQRTTTPIVEQRRAERDQLKHEQQTREPRPHLREDAKLVDEDREDQRPGGRGNRCGEGLRRHDASEQRHRESDQAIKNERPPRGEQGQKDQAGEQRPLIARLTGRRAVAGRRLATTRALRRTTKMVAVRIRNSKTASRAPY